MTTTLFLQSEIQDPYSLYKKMITQDPVYWDEENQIWALYSYDACVSILNNNLAHIPEINPNNEQGLNDSALEISNQLARLSNGAQHDISREVAMFLFSKMNVVDTYKILEELIESRENKSELNWVNSVCKKLPVLVVLKSFDFNGKDSLFILENIGQLIQIMLPNKTQTQVDSINTIAKEIYAIAEKNIVTSAFYATLEKTLFEKYKISAKEILSLCVSNIIGLFIQSYDAGRGLLSNALLQILNKEHSLLKLAINRDWMQSMIIESLRFDPPIHTTRRVAVGDIVLNDKVIKKGDKMILVLASANRDSKQFLNPEDFDSTRVNNGDHLTFGIGGHGCLAKHFSIRLGTDALLYLFEQYKNVSLLDENIEYEPLSNARLPKNILVSI
ncbi:cytochrome P450 [Flavobacterium aestivum]|uniref:cytochrome P450 n=1 Tax=Flavobacterium aestivum TaxID=3003257 RepID=UPI0024831165|nr:cytochrome P450 [Flavobacterium aestivum]